VQQGGLVLFHLHDDVVACVFCRLEGLCLAIHGIKGEHTTGESQASDEGLGGGNLVRLFSNLFMREDDITVRQKDAQLLKGFLVLKTIKTAAQGFAIPRQTPQRGLAVGQGLTICAKTLLQFFGGGALNNVLEGGEGRQMLPVQTTRLIQRFVMGFDDGSHFFRPKFTAFQNRHLNVFHECRWYSVLPW
jgi:hypothetical protein